MKRVLQCFLLLAAVAGIPGWGQERVGLGVAGYAGLGAGQTFTSTDSRDSSVFDYFTDIGITAQGYLYDPRLVGFYGTVSNGLSSSGGTDLSGYSTTDWTYYGGLNFFPERNFPFSLYASRSNSSTDNSLFPSVTNVMSSWGAYGSWANNPIGKMGYSFSKSTTDQQAPGLPDIKTETLTANYTLTRKQDKWDLRFSDNYWRATNPFFFEANGTAVNAETTSGTNTVEGNAIRQFGETRRLSLEALYASSSTTTPQSSPADSSSMFLSADYTWRLTPKLDTGYGGFYQRDHVSAVNVVNVIGGSSNILIPSVDNSVASGYGRATYHMTDHLSFLGGVDYSHNNYGDAQQANPGQFNRLAQDLLMTRAGYDYRWDLWKLHWSNSGQVIWQYYGLLQGGSDSGLGYEERLGIDGGRISKLRYHLGVRYVDQANPIYFQYINTRTEAADAHVDTSRFRWIRLGANASFVFNQYDLSSGTQNGKAESFGGNADIPTWNLGFFVNFMHSNGTERFFNALPGLQNPGPPAGTTPFVPTLLNANDLARAGVSWSHRNNLKVGSYYNRTRYSLAFNNTTITTDSSWDTLVQYLFGRFTIYAGYSRGLNEVQPVRTNLNRWFIRVRFPFHIWQRG